MTISVQSTNDGQFMVSDNSGHLVDGPFVTNAEAWKALDRLAGESDHLPKPKSQKKVLWGAPEKKSKKAKRKEREERKEKNRAAHKEERRTALNAAKAPGWLRTIAAVKFDPAARQVYRDHKLGTFGAASEVKRIDPAVYLAEKAARGEA